MTSFSKEHILRYCIKIGIGLTLLALLGTPLIVTAYFKSAFQLIGDPVITAVIIGIYACSIPYLWALFKLHTLSTLVIQKTPFNVKSEQALKQIALCALSEVFLTIGVVYILKHTFVFFEHTLVFLPLFIISFLCLVVSLLCFVLSKLFEKARRIKEENDLTI